MLLTIDDRTVLTREDLQFALAYEDEAPDEDFFLELAEQAICAYLAEEDGVAESEDAIRAEYEIYLESISEAGLDSAYTALRAQFSALSDAEFDALYIAYLQRAASASAMLDTIADVYGNVVDPQTIRENIAACLTELASFYTIVVSYPELEDYCFRFTYLS